MTVEFERLPRKAQNKIEVLEKVLNHAKDMMYIITKVDYNNGLIRFQNGGVCINLYTSTFTISTELNHPKKGKTQLHRKNLMIQEVMAIFNNPRKHTGAGYYKKN